MSGAALVVFGEAGPHLACFSALAGCVVRAGCAFWPGVLSDAPLCSARHPKGRGAAPARVAARTLVVGITTDLVFPLAEMRRLAAMIPGSTYHEIVSDFGHDGFLVEHEQLNTILYPFVND